MELRLDQEAREWRGEAGRKPSTLPDFANSVTRPRESEVRGAAVCCLPCLGRCENWAREERMFSMTHPPWSGDQSRNRFVIPGEKVFELW